MAFSVMLVVFEHLFERGREEQLPGSAGHEEDGDEFEAAGTFAELPSPLSESSLFFLKLLRRTLSASSIYVELSTV